MFRDHLIPSIEGEKRQLESFIRDVESHIKVKERLAFENNRNRVFFESLGGELMGGMDLPEGTLLLAKSVAPESSYGFVQPVNMKRGFKKTVIKEFLLKDILAEKPEFPDFWEKVAQHEVVQSIHFGQDVFDTNKTDSIVTIGKDGDVVLPEIHVEFLDDSNVQLLYSAPKSTSYLWPHCLAEDTFVFGELPKELDRGFRVYDNACVTRGMNLFDDVSSPMHYYYKAPWMAKKRLSIRYNIAQPNRMRPVEI